MKQKTTFFRGVLLNSLLLLATLSVQAQWVTVGPTNGPDFKVNDLQTFNNDLYAAGASTDGSKGIAKWDGKAWTSIARVYPKFKQFTLGVNALAVYNNQIVAAGITDSIAGIYTGTSDVVTYNGTSWSKLGSNPPDLGQVNCLAVYNNELYVGGYGINKWNGSSWTSVAVKTKTTVGSINTMTVYNNELYVGGNFSKIANKSMTSGLGFAKWDGSNWTVLPGFFDTIPTVGPYNVASVACMMPFQGNLYAVGDMNTAGTTHLRGAAKWNGTAWSDVNGGIKGTGTLPANCLATDANNLYLVGSIQAVNTANDSVYLAARWDGNLWHPMLGTSSPYGFFSVENHNNEIYAAYQSMVKWTGEVVTGLDTQTDDNGFSIYPALVIDRLHLQKGKDNESIQVQIYNSSGALVHAEKVDTSTDVELNCAGFAPGMYYLKTTGVNTLSNHRFIKQ